MFVYRCIQAAVSPLVIPLEPRSQGFLWVCESLHSGISPIGLVRAAKELARYAPRPIPPQQFTALFINSSATSRYVYVPLDGWSTVLRKLVVKNVVKET